MPDNLLPANSVHVGGVNTSAATDPKIEKSAPKGLVAVLVFVLGLRPSPRAISKSLVDFVKEHGRKWTRFLALVVLPGLIGPKIVLYMSATMIAWLPFEKGNSVIDCLMIKVRKHGVETVHEALGVSPFNEIAANIDKNFDKNNMIVHSQYLNVLEQKLVTQQ